jgi:hypothetical protein
MKWSDQPNLGGSTPLSAGRVQIFMRGKKAAPLGLTLSRGTHSSLELVNSSLAQLLRRGVFEQHVVFLNKIVETVFNKVHEHTLVLGRRELAPPLCYRRAELSVPWRAFAQFQPDAEPRQALLQMDCAPTRQVGRQSQINHGFRPLGAFSSALAGQATAARFL